MPTVNKSVGDGNASDSELQTGPAGLPRPEGGLSFFGARPGALPDIPMRAGDITLEKLVNLYMTHYAGRDSTRPQRLSWWVGHIGTDRAWSDLASHCGATGGALRIR